MTAARVSVVVTNFDGEGYLPGMMEALQATGYPFHEIIVSDDASRDGSRLLVRHRFPQVTLVSSDLNRGPAAARNAGIRAASGELVLLLDNDGYPLPDAIEPMVNALLEEPDVVAVMPRVILRGDPPHVHCDGSRTHFTGQMWLANGHVPVGDVSDRAPPIDGLMGTAMMFRREIALRIGGFEPDYFFYYEDHDFGTRMRILGGPLRSVPAARVEHLGGTADLSFRQGGRYPTRRIYLTAKNRVMFGIRNLQGRTMGVLLPAWVLHELAQMMFAAARGWIGPYLQGLTWNVTHLSRTLRKREGIQAARSTPDSAILQDGALPLHPGVMKAAGPAAWLRGLLESVLGVLFRGLRRFL